MQNSLNKDNKADISLVRNKTLKKLGLIHRPQQSKTWLPKSWNCARTPKVSLKAEVEDLGLEIAGCDGSLNTDFEDFGKYSKN